MYSQYEKLLKERGIRSADVARATGIKPSTITDWKNGRTKSLSAENIRKLADFFGVPVDYFYERTYEMPEYVETLERKMESFYSDPDVASFAQAIHDKPEIRGLFKAARDLSKEDIDRFKEIIESYERGKQG